MVLRYRLIKVDTINDFSHQHLFKTEVTLFRQLEGFLSQKSTQTP